MESVAAVPRPPRAGRALLGLGALCAWLGLVLQLVVSVRAAGALSGALWALGYFTVLTNLLVAVVATATFAGRHGWLTAPGTLAALAVYIFVVVGVIYSLLRSLWAPTGWHQLADACLHDLVPVLYVLWWLCYAPRGGLSLRQPLRWLGYPLAYYVFSLLLGAVTGRYLYPFADVARLGFVSVARNGALLLGLFFMLGLMAVAVDLRRAPRPVNPRA